MPFTNAQQARVLIGILHASAYTRSFQADTTTDMLDVTTIINTAKAFIPGQDTSTFTIAGPLDTDAAVTGQAAILAAQKAAGVDVPITVAMQGLAIGSRAYMVNGLVVQLQDMSSETGTADWSLNAQTDGYTDWNGVTLSDLIAVTTDTNGTAVDNGGATTNGGVAHLHVTAFSGFTSNAVRIEHSATGVGSWTTIATFATATGTTSERVVVAPGTSVSQYLRVVDDVTGTGSCTRIATFARR